MAVSVLWPAMDEDEAMTARMTYYERLLKYEAEKKRLQGLGLRPEEYEREIRKLCERLKV